jgi:hypothetical protein
MILPKKHLTLDESYLGFGAFLLMSLNSGEDVDSLWEKYISAFSSNKYSVKFSFDEFIIVVDFLFIIGAIRMEKGKLYCETN